MATVNFLLRTKKNPANINIRFTHGRNIDIFDPLNIYVNPIHWNKDLQKIRNVIEVQNRDSINQKLAALKVYVLEQYNIGNMTGVVFDKQWLNDAVKKHFNRPANEVNKVNLKHHIYYSDFVDWWLENKSKTWKNSKNKILDISAIEQYNSFNNLIKKFEIKIKRKLKFKDITTDELDNFIDYLQKEEKYASSTIKRHVGRFRFFCNRAEALNIEVNKNFKDSVYVDSEEEILEPYLNEEEINRIFSYDFTYDEILDNVRDNFIIGLWTGLRISDFNNRLDVSNIKNDFIEIKTKKTGAWTTIPLHPQVKSILNKRFGNLPLRFSDQKFNEEIKNICRICNIKNIMHGKVFDAETKRNKIGYYPKWKLVSSHICRRSFATNLFGVVSNSVIQNVGAWKTEIMMLHYIKKSKKEHAEELKKTWDKKYN